MLRVFRLLALFIVGLWPVLCAVNAQQFVPANRRPIGPAIKSAGDLESTRIEPSAEAILEEFRKTENRVREQMNQHTFKREVVLQTIGRKGEITGQYVRHSQFLFDDYGNRIERVTYRPPSTIREMRITREDIQDLAGAQLLGIDIAESAKYELGFAGSDVVEGRQTYIINVAPNATPNPSSDE